jgi:hypothetical protein
MLARRVIAISPDKAIAKQLGAGLMAAGGSVETVPSVDALAKGEIQAGLVVVHIAGDDTSQLDQCHERIRKDGWIIVILPKSDLKVLVASMQKTDRIAGVLVSDELTVNAVAAMATRLLHGDIFGLEKVVPWGTKVYSTLVGDYQEKSICISQLSEFAASMGVRRKYREAIEQVADELLMNALYDAPVDSSGKQLFADVPTKTRISLRMEQKAVVQYSCDGSTFCISVRDSFGTLARGTVLKYLHKCLYAEQQIDRKAGGAGLGLYIMANATSTLIMNCLPGVATEVVCTFDLKAPKVMLKQFGFFDEKIDAAGRLVGGRSQLVGSGVGPTGFPIERRHESRPPASRAVIFGLSAAIVLLVALIGLVAYPRFATKKAAITVNTEPPDARVEIDGRERGIASAGKLRVADLEVGRAYKVSAHRDGYNSATTVVEPSEDRVVSVSLALEPRATVVFVDSDPEGASVVYDGKDLGTTPISVDALPPGETVDLVFKKAGYRDVTRQFKVPRPGSESSISVSLRMDTNFGSVVITTEPPGAQVLQNGELLAGATTPIDEHIVQAGKRYTFTVKLPGYMPMSATRTLKAGDRSVPLDFTLEKGGGLSITANIDGRVSVSGVKACDKRDLPMLDCPVPNGKYKVRIEGTRPYAYAEVPVTIKGNEVRQDLQFGFVEAVDGCVIEIRRNRTAKKVAFLEGSRKVSVNCGDGAERNKVSVRVNADRTATVP